MANIFLDGRMVSYHLLIQPSHHFRGKHHKNTSVVNTAHQLKMQKWLIWITQQWNKPLAKQTVLTITTDSTCFVFILSPLIFQLVYDSFSLLTCHFYEENAADGGVLYILLLSHAMSQFLSRLEIFAACVTHTGLIYVLHKEFL